MATLLYSERRSIMSNRSGSWMEDDDNDFEVTSCMGACGRLLGGSYPPYKPGRPLTESEQVEEEGLNADHFEVHQVSVSAPAVHENIPGCFACVRLRAHLVPLQTFRHGLPHQPSCLAYDSVEQLLAIGSHQGEIAMYPHSP